MALGSVPVVLITGFLGSGKTTLLKKIAQDRADRRILWIVNEFGALDIDGEVLRAAEMEILSVPGGSIFCNCLAATFQRIMGKAAGLAASGQLDGVVIEASGIACPSAIDRMLSDFSLDSALAVASVVCVVDAGRFSLIRQALACVDAQIGCGGLMLLNKADMVDGPALARVESEIRTLTQAPILRCAHCAVDFDPFQWWPRRLLQRDISGGSDGTFAKFFAETDEVLDLDRLSAELSAIAPSLYRCKGVLRVSNGTTEWVLLDWTPSEYSVKPFSGLRPRNGGVVLIAKRGMEGPAQNLVHSIERRGMRTG